MAEDRITVQEAARRLGVKDDAIRKRIQRGSLRHEKDSDGRVYVFLDAAQDAAEDKYKDKTQDARREELVEELRDRVQSLERQLDQEREANRENRRLLAAALERIPELEAPTSPERPPGGPESAGEAPVDARMPEGASDPEMPSSRPSWWRRLFGG